MKCDNQKCDVVFNENYPVLTVNVGDQTFGAYWGNFCSHGCALAEIAGLWLHIVDGGGTLLSWQSKVQAEIAAQQTTEAAPEVNIQGMESVETILDEAATFNPDNGDGMVAQTPPQTITTLPDLNLGATESMIVNLVGNMMAVNSDMFAAMLSNTTEYAKNGYAGTYSMTDYKVNLCNNKLQLKIYPTVDDIIIVNFNNEENHQLQISTQTPLPVNEVAQYVYDHILAVMENFDSEAAEAF